MNCLCFSLGAGIPLKKMHDHALLANMKKVYIRHSDAEVILIRVGMKMTASLWGTRSIMRLVVVLWAWAGSLCLTIVSSNVPGDGRGAPDVGVMIGDITDNRTTGQFFGECEIQLKIIGDAVAESAGLHAIRIKSAVDDTGRDLLKEDESSPSLDGVSTEQKTGIEKTVKLKNPARSAKFIKLLDGEVELFQPTPANGGVIIEKRFMARANEPLPSPALKKWNVRITYMTKEGLEAKKKEIEKKQEAGEKIGDGQGKPIETNSRTRSGPLVAYGFSEALPGPEAQLVIYLATPASLKVVPFKVENIPLP
jgi:hypothetical protein